MAYTYKLRGYYKVRRDQSYAWPWIGDKNRTVDVFVDDVLTRTGPNEYTMHTGIMKTHIQIPDDDVVYVEDGAALTVSGL